MAMMPLLSAAALNNRDWALLFWVAVLLTFLILNRDLRSGVAGVVRSLAHPKLSGSLLLMAAWTYGLILIGRQVGLWESRLLKDTVYWFLASAVVLWLKSADVVKPNFFRRTLASALGATLLLEFYLNLYVFGLVWEVIFLPVIALFAAASAFAEAKKEYQPAKKLFDTFLALVGFGSVAYVTAEVVRNWPEVLQRDTAQDLILPAWLTLGVVPFVFALGLAVNYETAFLRINFFEKELRPRLRLKLALLSVCHVRPTRLGVLAGPASQQAAGARSFGEARRKLKTYLTQHALEQRRTSESGGSLSDDSLDEGVGA